MKLLGSAKHPNLWRFCWHILFALMIVVTFLLKIIAVVSKHALDPESVAFFDGAAEFIFSAALLVGLFGILLLLYESTCSCKENSEKLDNAVEMLRRNRNLLTQISQGVRLSDSAKEIAFRDTQQMELAEAVLTKLHQHDFDEAEAMIEALGRCGEYKVLTGQLRKATDRFRNATEEQRVEQVILHIDKLCEEGHWAQAEAQIESLIKTFPYSDKAKAMPRKLQERKNKRKRELLAGWDKAVKNKDTDLSLAILKELDMYLTPSEGLALQESASSVFRTKLHNLGVQFALAVSEKRWKDALGTGRHIVSDFPNSRMAKEIRSKMDILQERAKA
jgi:outer membrane protein assembly factor BamD (BamD/ComL family)